MTEPRPVRLQLSRKKGFNLQAWSREVNGLPAVKVDRATRWGNPFRFNHPGSPLQERMPPELSVVSFRLMLEKEGGWFAAPLPWPKGKIPAAFTTVAEVREQLRGKNLACWCKLPLDGKPDVCHASYLLELANAPIGEDCDAVVASCDRTAPRSLLEQPPGNSLFSGGFSSADGAKTIARRLLRLAE